MKRSRWVRSEHECNQPAPGRRGAGSVWECRCGRRWRIVSVRTDGMYSHTRWAREADRD